jgi:hypothetical protein
MLQGKFKDTYWVIRSRKYRRTDNTGEKRANQRATKHYTEKRA